MSKNKQPRDGNGKFTKMIKVTDKFGNAAYFTPEEMGGFNKAIPMKNPDCEPATKAYVKDLMRKTREHTHIMEGDGFPTIMSVAFGWIVTIGFGICILSKNLETCEIGNKYFVPFLLFSIAMSCILYEIIQIKSKGIRGSTPHELYRYTPPRMDECKEE